MDLNYPLRYDSGSLLLTDGREEKVSQGRHLIDTLLGERLLSLGFGVDISMIYSIPVTEIVSEKIRLALENIQQLRSDVKINRYDNGRLYIDILIYFDDGSETFLSVPING